VLIDWFTVGAQAINFLILVWLLRRYLYKPVLAAIDAREQKIAARIKDAETQESNAKAAAEELRRRNSAFDQERDALMRKAMAAADTERQRLIESARQDSEQLRVKLTQALGAERAELGRQLSVRTQAEVFALTGKALSELAGTSLEDRMIDVLIERLRALPLPQRLALAGTPADIASVTVARKAAVAPVILVRSAGDPSPAGRTKLEAAIRELLGATIVIRYETAPELVGGLELSVAGQKLAWSVADYLSSLAQDATAIAATELAAPTEIAAHAA
jgi:F-type H+-transporting ATPase subunit b